MGEFKTGFKNLAERSPEERRRIQSMGGKARQAKAKRARALSECAAILMSCEVPTDAKDKLREMGIDDNDMINAMLITVRMFKEAVDGNVGAYKALLEAEKNTNAMQIVEQTDDLSEALANVINSLDNKPERRGAKKNGEETK